MNDQGSKRFQRTREDHRSELAEDYVELVYQLSQQHGSARVVQMAARLGVSQVTVSKAVRRLVQEGYVDAKPYSAITLTERGLQVAMHAAARHKVVVAFLISLGVPPEIAETDAEGIEHHVSPVTLQAMKDHLEP